MDAAEYSKYIQEQFAVSNPWLNKLTATYETDFAPRVNRIYLEFKKIGITQGGIRSVKDGILGDNEVYKIPGWLVELAHQADEL